MIGIIGAMEEEVSALKEEMQTEEIKEIAGMTFVKGVLCGRNVVVVRSGIGKVNAALCAQILASEFGVDALINTGIAGSLDARIDIGDIVISTDSLYHDMDASTFGNPVGQIPRHGRVFLLRGRIPPGQSWQSRPNQAGKPGPSHTFQPEG